MTSPLHALASPSIGGPPTTDKASPTVDPKALKAAKDFESIFLRTLLSSLEKTTAVGAGGKPNTAQSTYGSMVVGAMAEQISSSGGIGLAEIIAKSLSLQVRASAENPNPPK